MLFSRRYVLTSLLAMCVSAIAWFNFAPTALAIGGKLPALNQTAPEFSLPTNTGSQKVFNRRASDSVSI